MNTADIEKLFDYTEWANARVMDASAGLSDGDLHHDFGISHKSVFGTLLHMAGAEWIWLERWNGHSPSKDEAWPRWSEQSCPSLADLNRRWVEIVEKRRQFFSQLDDSSLARELSFTLINGESDSMPLGYQMQHVVNHATLHRGQIVGLIRQLGIAPPSTDLLFYLRSSRTPAISIDHK